MSELQRAIQLSVEDTEAKSAVQMAEDHELNRAIQLSLGQQGGGGPSQQQQQQQQFAARVSAEDEELKRAIALSLQQAQQQQHQGSGTS
mmetsp:Transcript_452/g.747  ORF Transcript_452/g.747 Transcript_452/m.747 type:complete len:89 (+) Transcript_452:3-269(+)